MSLDERILRLGLWCANNELSARRAGKYPDHVGPLMPWNAEVVRALELEVATSPTRQELSDRESLCDHDNEWIGTRQAADCLGWTLRQVQRRAPDLEGRKISGRLVFPAAAVREYGKALKHGRSNA